MCACVSCTDLVGGSSPGQLTLKIDIATCTGICMICLTNELDYSCMLYDVISFLCTKFLIPKLLLWFNFLCRYLSYLSDKSTIFTHSGSCWLFFVVSVNIVRAREGGCILIIGCYTVCRRISWGWHCWLLTKSWLKRENLNWILQLSDSNHIISSLLLFCANLYIFLPTLVIYAHAWTVVCAGKYCAARISFDVVTFYKASC